DGNGIDDYSDATDWDTDIDGNGLPDLIGFAHPGPHYALNNGSSFAAVKLALGAFGASNGWQRAKHPRMVIDETGDGQPDIVGFADDGVYVSNRAGASFGAMRKWVGAFGYNHGWRVGNHQRIIADVTRDGLPDVVGFADAGVYVARNTGSSFATP